MRRKQAIKEWVEVYAQAAERYDPGLIDEGGQQLWADRGKIQEMAQKFIDGWTIAYMREDAAETRRRMKKDKGGPYSRSERRELTFWNAILMIFKPNDPETVEWTKWLCGRALEKAGVIPWRN